MPFRTRLLATALVILLAPACSDDSGNPFDQFSFSRAPSEDAILLYVSGAWSDQTGAPRELFALTAEGVTERLTTCTQREEPCDFDQATASSDPARITAVRGAIGGDPLASALYFMDLSRSVETIIAPARRIQSSDWTLDDGFLIYSNGDREDLFTVQPNGTEEQRLTETPDFRERYPRIAPDRSGAVYEGLTETPGKSLIYYFLAGQDPAFQVTTGGPGSEVLPDSPYVVGSDSAPAFAPDGQFIAFRRLTGTGNGGLGTWDILARTSAAEEGVEPWVVAGGGDVYRGPPDWGFDGRLVFVETDMETEVSSIVVIAPDGSNRQVLHTENAAYDMASPRWLKR
jgi:hypothetical protein